MDFKKILSRVIGFLVGFVILILMVALDNCFSLADRFSLYPLLGFGLPILIGYIVSKVFYSAKIPPQQQKTVEPNTSATVSDALRQTAPKEPRSFDNSKNISLYGNGSNAPNVSTEIPLQKENAIEPDICNKPEQAIPSDTSSTVNCSSGPKANRRKHYYPYFPSVLDGIPLAYYYCNNLISDIDSTLFDEIVDSEDYQVDVIPLSNGCAELQSHGKRLGIIQKFGKMVSDWITRGDPVICKITNLAEGKESVGIGFYKDMESRLKSRDHNVARLTKNRSEDMQISVSCLSDGEMLKYFPDCIDEEDAIPIQRITGEEVGFLPKKYNKIHEDFGICGVFVDHVDEIENDNGDYKYIAYVRVYWG